MLKAFTFISPEYGTFHKEFAFSFHVDALLGNLLHDIQKEMSLRHYFNETEVMDLLSVKIYCYQTPKPDDAFFAVTFDDSLNNAIIIRYLEQEIPRILKELHNLDPNNVQVHPEELVHFFEPYCQKILDFRPPKISVIGYDKVGKTSICRMIQGKTLDHLEPTMVCERNKFKFHDIPIHLWDFSDENDGNIWEKFLKGSDAVILVLDSTQSNAQKSMDLIGLTDRVVPHAELLIVANKQDNTNILTPQELSNILNNPVLPLSAKNPDDVAVLQSQIVQLLEIKTNEGKISPSEYIIQRND